VGNGFLGLKSMGDFLAEEKPPVEPVVAGKINKGELHTVIGPAKIGKSSFVQALAKSVVLGEPFLGFAATAGRVVYCQTELTPSNFEARMRTLFGPTLDELGDKFFVSFKRFRMDDAAELKQVRDELKELKPDLVIFDPLYTYHRKQEDLSSDMAPLLNDLMELIRAVGCAGILVHHAGKQGEGNLGQHSSHHGRGSSSIADVPDGTWTLRRTGQKDRYTLSATLRNAASLERLSLRCENLVWTLDDAGSAEESQGAAADIPLLFKADEERASGDLVKDMTAKWGISERTAEKRLKQAVANSILVQPKHGFYRLPKPPHGSSLGGSGMTESQLTDVEPAGVRLGSVKSRSSRVG
jgi:hypothetical protein